MPHKHSNDLARRPSAIALAILIPPLVILILEGVLAQTFLQRAVGLAIATVPVVSGQCGGSQFLAACAGAIEAEYAYSAIWLVFVTVAALAIVATVAFAPQTIPTGPKCYYIMVASIIGGAVSYEVIGGTRLYASIGDATFANTVIKMGFGPWLDFSIDVANGAAAWAASFVAVACCMTAHPLSARSPKVSDEEVPAVSAQLAERMATLRRNITFGAVLLVVGVVDTSEYLAWPLPLIDPQSRSAFSAVTGGLVTFQGAAYTLMLLLLYALPGGVIYRHSVGLADQRVSGDSNARSGPIVFALPRWLGDVIAVASPLIASQLAPLLQLATFT